MKRRPIALMLCVLLAVVLAGCGGETKIIEEPAAVLAPAIVQTLDLSDKQAKDLASSIQTLNLTSEQEDSTLRVIQTFGNDRELYVFYEVTFADGVPLPDPEEGKPCPVTYTLTGQEERNQHSTSQRMILPCEDNTFTYLSYFLHRKGSPWPEGELQFTIEGFSYDQGDTPVPVTEDVHTLTWTPTNQGTILSGDIAAEDGTVLGNVTLSPFSLIFSLDASQAEEFSQVVVSTRLVYADGTTSYPDGLVAGGSTSDPLRDIQGNKVFRSPIDISQVTAVQIDGHTVTF